MQELEFDYPVPPIGGILDVAERHEIDPGASTVHVPFTITFAPRQSVSVKGQSPAPVQGRLEYIAIMCGPRVGRRSKKQPKKLFGLTQGADDQLIITADPEHLTLKDGQQRIVNSVSPGQTISGAVHWDRATQIVRFELSTGQTLQYGSRFNMDAGGRIVLGVDEGDADRHAELFTWPPSGARITGRLVVDGTGGGTGIPTPPDRNPIDPLPPVVLPPVVLPPPVTTAPTPTPGSTLTPPASGNRDLFGISRTDLAQLLRTLATALESGKDIDIRTLLLPIVLQQILARKGGEDAALLGPIISLLIARL